MVWRSPSGGKKEVPEEQLRVPGQMSEARRARLREAITRRWPGSPASPPPPLNDRTLEQLAGLEHVEAVVPNLAWTGNATLRGQRQYVQIHAGPLPSAVPPDRLLAGGLPTGHSAVLVSEHLLYLCGIRDEAEVEKMVGARLRLESEGRGPTLGALLLLLG